MVLTTEGSLEVTIESWPKWDFKYHICVIYIFIYII